MQRVRCVSSRAASCCGAANLPLIFAVSSFGPKLSLADSQSHSTYAPSDSCSSTALRGQTCLPPFRDSAKSPPS